MSMQSRRDLVQAHAYVVGRLVSALVRADPDASETPSRRNTVGWFSGLLVAAILIAGFAIFGLIFPGGGHKWMKPGALVVEKETGNRYVYLGAQLRPVLNTASVRLLLNGSPPLLRVARASLAGVPHGQPIGIVGAPDALPDRKLMAGAWQVCSSIGRDPSGTLRPVVTLEIGPAVPATPLGDTEAFLARGSDAVTYLVSRDTRFRLGAGWLADILGFGGENPWAVDAAWLNALPAGPDVLPVPVADRGQAGPAVDGHASVAGQVLVVDNVGTGPAFYLVRHDGLAPLREAEAAVVLGDPATAAVYGGQPARPVPASPATVSLLAKLAAPVVAALPGGLPKPVHLGALTPCARYDLRSSGTAATLVLAASVPAAKPVEDGPGVSRDARVAQRISVVAGGGALVRPIVAPGASGSAVYLVNDAGVKFPIGSEKAVTALGYSLAAARPVPPALLGLLPTGPPLNVPS
jgi:type VII secretion protein EccB